MSIFSGSLTGRGHALEPAHRAQADVEVEFLAQRDVERADAAADRRGQRALDRDDVVLEDRQRLLGQPDVRAVDLGRLLAGVDLHPVDLALAAVGLGDRGVDDLDHHRRDVEAGAVALDVRDDRLVRNVEAKIRVDGDLLAAGRDLDVLVTRHGVSLKDCRGIASYAARVAACATLAGGNTGSAANRRLSLISPDPATPRARPAPSASRGDAGVVLLQQALRRAVPVLAPTAAASRRSPTSSTLPGFYPAGRLDADSEGLVVLTADGALQARHRRPAAQARQDLLGPGRGRPRRRSSSPRCAAASRCGDFVDGAGAASEVIAEPPGLWPRHPPIRVRKAIPTAWLRAHADRGQEPAGAPDDRGGRPADAAAHSPGGRSVDGRGPRARCLARRTRRHRML